MISACVLNAGNGAWAFEGLAHQLAAALWVEVSSAPAEFNYLLFAEDFDVPPDERLFVPLAAMRLASDKRLLADRFLAAGVPTPRTLLIDEWDEVMAVVRSEPATEWCLKYPTACGASGHRLLDEETSLPKDWPRPFIIQEFVRLPRPEVYRTYAAGGNVFGWVARRFPPDKKVSPWVAHARGARYEDAGEAPIAAVDVARAALQSTGLLQTFGCADLLQRPTGEWLVLEVGTDGMYNHVDRDLGIESVENETQRRIAEAFWRRLGTPPWAPGPWQPKATASE